MFCLPGRKGIRRARKAPRWPAARSVLTLSMLLRSLSVSLKVLAGVLVLTGLLGFAEIRARNELRRARLNAAVEAEVDSTYAALLRAAQRRQMLRAD